MKNNAIPQTNDITGVILAGGRATRMGGEDKGLLALNGQTMVQIALEKLTPQVGSLIINANRHIEQYKKLQHTVVSDDDETSFHGPLAGILSAIKITKTPYILVIPCDSLLFPEDLSSRLLACLIENNADISVVHDGDRIQPTFALIKAKLKTSLEKYLDQGDRKIQLWYQQQNAVHCDFSDSKDIALNINTPEDLLKLEQKMKKLSQ